MKILNIHGYKGSAENAAFSALKALGQEVISPQTDYDRAEPKALLDGFIKTAKDSRAEMVAGTSYGGFFAALVSIGTGLPAVLVNPCFMAFYHLPLLGYRGDIAPLMEMFGRLTALDKSRVRCIIGGSDEVVTTHDFTRRFLGEERITVVPGGLHSGATLGLDVYFERLMQDGGFISDLK